jgi:predicted RNA methylase
MLRTYRMSDGLDEEVIDMGCGCSYSGSGLSTQKARSFLTREEKVELLKEYRNDLEKEAQGVSERIKELEVN